MLTPLDLEILAEMRKKPVKPDGERVLLGFISKLQTECVQLRGAIKRAGFAVMQTSGDWSIHDVSELAKAEERRTVQVINENVELSVENRKLKAELAVHLEGFVRDGSTTSDDEPGWLNVDDETIAEADRLVGLGLYERHPDGQGRRQFYRRLEQA